MGPFGHAYHLVGPWAREKDERPSSISLNPSISPISFFPSCPCIFPSYWHLYYLRYVALFVV